MIKPAGPVDYHISTGLTRPDVFDWPGELQRQIDRYHPDTVVIALGLNDAQQPMTLPNGTFLTRGGAGWRAEYRRRVGAMISIAQGAGARVVYVAPPPVSDAEYEPVPVQPERPDREGGPGPRGREPRSSPIPCSQATASTPPTCPIDGHQVLVRTPDGIHLTPAGNDLLTADVMKALGTIYQLPP